MKLILFLIVGRKAAISHTVTEMYVLIEGVGASGFHRTDFHYVVS